MIHCRLPRSARKDAEESGTLVYGNEGVLSVDSAFASLAEDEGLLDESLEAYASTVLRQQALISVGL